MALKYAALLPRCPDSCDCAEHYEPRAVTAFRLMRNPAAEDPDFVPSGAAADHRGPARCSNLALSFYNSIKRARKQFARLEERMPEVAKRCGDHVGKIDLTPADGQLSKKPSKSGHLNLFQEDGVLFVPRVLEWHPATVPGDEDKEAADDDA